jgi:hypothetical protein
LNNIYEKIIILAIIKDNPNVVFLYKKYAAIIDKKENVTCFSKKA